MSHRGGRKKEHGPREAVREQMGRDRVKYGENWKITLTVFTLLKDPAVTCSESTIWRIIREIRDSFDSI